jgi:magnesium-transporting ATPase (P-type)
MVATPAAATQSPPGLTTAEAAARAARGLTNRVRRSPLREYADIVRRNLFTVFNALVAPAALALFLLGGPENIKDALAISGMIVVNTLLGLAQEIRAKWHLDRLAILAETKARVLRDGAAVDVPAGDVVQGDWVLVSAGESIVADGAVLEAHFLEVDEALLTGESDPVPRRPGESVLSGSFCVAGEGCYRADCVGTEAFAHRTTAAARAYRHTTSPLQAAINRIVHVCTYTAVALVFLYVLIELARGTPVASLFREEDLMRRIAATITSMVPQGLVLMATLAFTLGAVRLARRGAVVQRLNAVEAMASIDVLCMDKTGTLTTNQLRVERLEVVGDLPAEEVRGRLRLFASAALDQGSKSLAALRSALGTAEAEALDQLPFKSQNRYSAVRVRWEGSEHVLVMGAGEALRPFIALEAHSQWEAAWAELMRTGLRLLLFAEAPGSGAPARFNGSLRGFALRPLALVALSDELRHEAAGVLKELAAQRIAFKIISGDNPETVRATVAPLAREAGLPSLVEAPVVTGAELEGAADRTALIDARSVFGRVSPVQKVEIVSVLKAEGRQVAMIGDGVNDVLPIKSASLGIAMGAGSRAAKTVSSLVLETNSFDLLPETLDEGRIIVRNVRRAAKLFLTKNVFALILILGTLPRYGLAFPFLPRHVTLLNFLTIGFPALLIMLTRGRVRSPSGESFLRAVGEFVLVRGLSVGVTGLAILMLSGWYFHHDEKTQQTLLLATLVLNGWWTLWLVARDQEEENGAWLRWLPLALLPVFLLTMYLPPANDFFRLTPLDLWQWSVVILGCLLGFFATVVVYAFTWPLFHQQK